MAEKQENKYKISVTGIMDFSNTPFHYYSSRILKNRPTSVAMQDGTALHYAVLEPERFEKEVYVKSFVPEGKILVDTIAELKKYLDCHKVEYKKSAKKPELMELFLVLRTELRDEVPLTKIEIDLIFAEKVRITEGSMSSVLKMRESALAHPWVKSNIDRGEKEVFVNGIIDGVSIRGRLDWAFQSQINQSVITDLKKCRSARRWDWEKTVYDMKYFVQAYLYSELYRQTFGRDVLYAYIPVEGAWPYITEVYAADDAQLDAGERVVKMALARFKKCVDTNHWPAYSDGKVQPCSLPEYGFKNIIAQEEWGEEGY